MLRRPAVLVVACALLVACGTAERRQGDAADTPDAPATTAAAPGPTASASGTPSPPPAPSSSPSSSSGPTATTAPPSAAPPVLSDAELVELGVNELGRVLVAQWHVVGDVDGEYRTSRGTFRAQLADLHARGYRPVTEAEFLAGTLPVPAGTSPVLLTFDDSTRDHLALDDTGAPAPDTVVGILEAFAADHPDWRATAVFAYNFPEPFGDADAPAKLRWLVDNGYELSNHTVGHVDLAALTSAEAEANLADNVARLLAAAPGAEVRSLTLPFGIAPDDPTVALRGEADGTSYAHDLVYLVGSDPARSPHHVAHDPTAVQRVPAHAVVGTGPAWFGDWLDRLDSTPDLRFVSDGDPTTVTYPTGLAEVAAVRGGLATREY